MPIRKRLDIKGSALAFVTTAVNEWQTVFSEPLVAEATLSQLAETSSLFGVSVVGYVLMPHHFHGLLGFKQIEKLSPFMQTFKSLSARRTRELLTSAEIASLTRSGRFSLWQPRFDDLIITSQEQLKIKLDYIHTNPVRAGLVTEPTDWRYSSARDWLGLGNGQVPIDKNFSWTA